MWMVCLFVVKLRITCSVDQRPFPVPWSLNSHNPETKQTLSGTIQYQLILKVLLLWACFTGWNMLMNLLSKSCFAWLFMFIKPIHRNIAIKMFSIQSIYRKCLWQLPSSVQLTVPVVVFWLVYFWNRCFMCDVWRRFAKNHVRAYQGENLKRSFKKKVNTCNDVFDFLFFFFVWGGKDGRHPNVTAL